MFINTTVTTIYPVTPEQKQAFILDSSLATVSNLSASSLTPVSPSYVGAPVLIFTLYLEQSSLGGDLFIPGTLPSIKRSDQDSFYDRKREKLNLLWRYRGPTKIVSESLQMRTESLHEKPRTIKF